MLLYSIMSSISYDAIDACHSSYQLDRPHAHLNDIPEEGRELAARFGCDFAMSSAVDGYEKEV